MVLYRSRQVAPTSISYTGGLNVLTIEPLITLKAISTACIVLPDTAKWDDSTPINTKQNTIAFLPENQKIITVVIFMLSEI